MTSRAALPAALVSLPGVAAASTGGATGPAILALLLLAPVAIVATAITWPFLPAQMKDGPITARLRKWLLLACAYDLLLLAACAKACGLM